MDWSFLNPLIEAASRAIENADHLAAHALLALFVILGLLGSLFPAVPGAALICAGAVLHGLLTGWDPLGLGIQVALLVMAGLSWGIQYLVSALGAKKYGASNWGVAGALLGLVLGVFIPIPILGPFLGAFGGALLLEYWAAGKDREEATRAGFGAVLGAVMGIMAEFGMALVMAVVVVVSFF